MEPNHLTRDDAIRTAREWLSQTPLFLDTETTDLIGEICDLAVLEADGTVRLNTLIQPTVPIGAEATALHGITDALVARAPTFADVHPLLLALLRERLVVIYNADFDVSRLITSAQARGLVFPPTLLNGCAMRLYAQFYGDWDGYHGNYHWQKLGLAARQCGVHLPAGVAPHRAAADAELARRIVIHVAEATTLDAQP